MQCQPQQQPQPPPHPGRQLDAAKLMSAQTDDVARLLACVWRYVTETGRHRIDWRAVAAVCAPPLPWGPAECQAVWRYVAYTWRPADDAAPGGLVECAADPDAAESDMDERSLLHLQRVPPVRPTRTGRHRIDWRAVAAVCAPPLPWGPAECQAVWRYVAYTWRPADDAAPGGLVECAADPDAAESDMDERSLLHLQRHRALPMSPAAAGGPAQGAAAREEEEEELHDAKQQPEKVRKARKMWKPEEDSVLLAAIEQYGDGSWQTIRQATGLDRTPTQLSQRFQTIKKKVLRGGCDDERRPDGS
eukprot:m51a1_g11460 hypothetical protein (304) ;mRNA; r:7888-9608